MKQLPQEWTASQIFELFRPFGPLRRVAIQLDPSSSNFTGLSVVEFYQEAHAAQAASHLHFSDQEGQTISVQPYETSKGPTRGLTQMMANWVQAPEFHPAAQQGYPYGPVQPPPEAVYGPPASYMTTPPAATSSWASPSGPAYMPQQPFQASPQASPGSNVPADPWVHSLMGQALVIGH